MSVLYTPGGILGAGSGGGGGGTSSTFGAAFPATGTAAGFIDGSGNMAGVKVDASGFLKVNVAAGGAGGGAVTVADAADVVEGALADAAVTGDNSGTVSAKLRGLNKVIADVWDSTNHRVKVDGSAVTQPISAAALPLPSGAATAAKQPALGTAGTASADVISIQGITSMTPLTVASHAVTNAGTFAVQAAEADGANVTLGAKADAKSTATDTTPITAMSVLKQISASVQAPPSQAVTNAGTFAVQAAATVADGANAVEGVTTGAAVITDANGTIQQYLRGLVKLAITAGGWLVSGAGAANAAVAGNPIRNGVLGATTLPTIVTAARLVDILADRYGRLYTVSPVVTTATSNGTAITTNTNTTIVAAPSSGNHLRIYRLWAQNSGSTGTWCYWGNGSAVKTIPFYLAQYQPFSMAVNGAWELSTATGLFMNTATTGANIEWFVEYETLAD